MNDFDHANERPANATDAEVVASGLLARERYRPGARLEVVSDAEQMDATERLYREIPVRVDGVRTGLLVGPWCELRRSRSYRIRRRGGERTVTSLVTVEVVESDADGHRYRE